MKTNERFAPSPSGPLHLGHAYSAILAWNNAQKSDGTFLLRIEDIDQSRSKASWEEMIYDDLRWLGLDWPAPVLRQSDRLTTYHDALQSLWAKGLLYPCKCKRRDIQEASRAPQEGAPIHGPDGLIYPGTCRREAIGTMPADTAIRLDIEKATNSLSGTELMYVETGRDAGAVNIQPKELIGSIGDVVLARKGMGTSYHLSVVLDDAAQNISQVTRGEDLQDATPIHVLLQRLFGLPTPKYHHHKLIRDKDDKRLAKRDDAKSIAKYRKEGAAPDDIFELIGIRPLALK